jgi:5-methylcytosine-specific restriction endonuclease McrA
MLTQKQFYHTRAWKRARADYIAYRKSIDGGTCEVCGQEPGRIVHHKIWLDDTNCNDPEISLNPDNFMYECQTCHNKEVDPRKESPGRVRYGPNGEIIRNTVY